MRREKRAQRLHLIRLDADDEAVWRIRAQRRLPAMQEVPAYQRQGQERHHAHAQGHHLYRVAQRVAAQIGEAITKANAAAAAQPRQQPQCDQRQHGRHRRRGKKTSQHVCTELQVLRFPQHEPAYHGEPQRVARSTGPSRHTEFAAQHAQRRDLREAHQRRQGKTEQQQHAGSEAIPSRREAGPRQRDAQKSAQPRCERKLGGIADDTTCHAGGYTQRGEMQQIQTHDGRLRRADATHHCATVKMAAQKAPRGERDRHRGQHDADQRGEPQEALRPLECRAYLRARVAYALDALSGADALLRPSAVGSDRRGVARHVQPIAHAAAILDQSARGQVGFVDDQPGRTVQKPD